VHPLKREASSEPVTAVSPAHDDAMLVASLLRKDRKATADFVARYSDSVYGYVRAHLAPQYDHVDDVVQEVFLAAWKGLEHYRGAGPLQAWILGIARHRVEDYYRQRLRMPEYIDDSEEEFVSATAESDFAEVLEQEELRTKARLILHGLPETYRLALVWRYWHEITAREMAFKTGKTEKAIERLLARARAEFRERWTHGLSSR
jgi:RNA polymerase sigma-70 factor, ECF subfamily